MASQTELARLEELAHRQRCMLIRLCGHYDGFVHIGGDLSMTDVLIALYHYGMRVDPADIARPDRDRFILSKGHGAVCMYIAMALRGFFDFDEILATYGQVDTAFGMHPCKVHLPGVECSSGSLGHGLPMAVGMALHARQRGESHRVFCLMGDGETCEGSVWESACCAGSYRLGNLVAVVDRNRQFMTEFSDDKYIHLEPYAKRWEAFGWKAVELDGHDMAQIVDAIDDLPPPDSGTPTVLICNTLKGKGISFMERNLAWHSGSIDAGTMEACLEELNAQRKGAAANV